MRHLLLLASAALLGSCMQLGLPVSGSGERAEVTRVVEAFDSVELAVPCAATVRVGSGTSVTLSGDDDLLPHVTTEVRRGRLVIELEGNYRFRQELRVEITTPRLSSVALLGSGDVPVAGVTGAAFRVSVEGSGDIVALGEVGRLEASIDGSGDLRLQRLVAQEASITIEGSGAARLNAERALRYRIDGSGDVSYVGSPEVSGGISGSGSVRQE